MAAGIDRTRRIVKWSLLVGGTLCLFVADVFPTDLVARHAVPASVIREFQEKGIPERAAEMTEKFKFALTLFRCALAAFGVWGVWLGILWSRLSAWAAAGTFPDADTTPSRRSAVWCPVCWSLLAAAVAVPLLFKGFEHTEVTNLVMLARRGPLVTMACQNLPPRVAQIGFTAVESLFVKGLGDSEAAARLPALIFGVLAMFPLFAIGRRYGGLWLANLACASLLATGFYLFYATYARGYALAMAAYIACTWLAIRLRDRDTWPGWLWLGGCMIVAAYAHLASGVYIACLCLIVIADRLARARRAAGSPGARLTSLVKPVVVFGTSLLVLLVLYSVAIPMEMDYMATFSMTSYYDAYHVNADFLRMMMDLWSWARGVSAVGWVQGLLFLGGAVWAGRCQPWPTLYLLGPAVAMVSLIAVRGIVVYPRYFFHFLPAYALLSVALPAAAASRLGARRPMATGVVCAAVAVALGASSLARLYGMERCGARSAVAEARSRMGPGQHMLAALDGYLTARYYFPQTQSGYRDWEFRAALASGNPPEFVLSVPYLDMDIPDGTQKLSQNYDLFRVYSSWLNVDGNENSVLLYRRRAPQDGGESVGGVHGQSVRALAE